MITVTASTPTPTNSLTALASPAVETVATAQTLASGAVSSENFSSALNDQLNLTAQPTAVTLSDTAVVELLANSEVAATVVNAVAVSAETVSQEASAAMVSANAVMSEQDSAILSNVTDTLKFMTSGAKLGDTLATQLPVMLPNVTLSPMQIDGQVAANQPILQTPVSTPASVLAKQITPVQVGLSQTPSSSVTDVAAILVQPPELNTAASQVNAENVPQQNSANLVATSNQATQQSSVASQAHLETPNQANVEKNAAQQTPSSAMSLTEAQTSQIVIDAGTANATLKQSVSTTENVVTASVLQQGSNASAQNTVITSQVESSTVQATVLQTTQTSQLMATDASAQSLADNVAQPASPKTAKAQMIVTTPAVVDTTSASTENVTLTLADAALGQPSVEKQSANLVSSTDQREGDQTPLQTVVDTGALDTQVAMQMTPQVAAQDVPVERMESDVIFDKAGDNTTSDKATTTLTSAKTLLMEAVANRNNGGDAGNSNQNSNSQNTHLNVDASSSQTLEAKQGVDNKSFAALLGAEKADAASLATTDKTAMPQSINTAVNKLAQDMKADVAPLTRPLSHPQWNEDLGERIVWMNSRGISSAEIKMNPEHMGPISVRIDLNQDQATIAFTAQNSAVREALEASLPKLREMLSAQQVNLADVSVSQQSTSNSDSGRSAFAQASADMSNGQQSNRQNVPEVDAEGNSLAPNTNDESIDEFANGQVIHTNGTNGLLSLYA